MKYYETEVNKCKVVCTPNQDLTDLDIALSFEDIKNISKNELSEFLNKKIEGKAFEYLIKMKQKHSKMENLNYEKLEIKEYLTSNAGLTKSLRNFAIQARCKMLDLKSNFKSAHINDLQCRICNDAEEEQPHLLDCSTLNTNSPNTVNQPVYEDLFSDDATKVKILCEKMKGNMMRFKEILNRPRDRRGDTARSVSQ